MRCKICVLRDFLSLIGVKLYQHRTQIMMYSFLLVYCNIGSMHSDPEVLIIDFTVSNIIILDAMI